MNSRFLSKNQKNQQMLAIERGGAAPLMQAL